MTGVRLAETLPAAAWQEHVLGLVAAGHRFAGLSGAVDGSQVRLTATVASRTDARLLLVDGLADRASGYPSLTPQLPPAFWYERAVHDLTGLVPHGHPRLDPLVLVDHEQPLPAHLVGAGMFTLPHGPVRSGVLESVEFLLETPGEDIPHLRVRPHHKHRGLHKCFEGMSVADGLLLAERVEGIAAVAHAVAYAQAVEGLAHVTVPRAAELIRLVHAELERLANHLDVAMRLADAAALAVAAARFGWHKERLLRLRSELSGSRFGRGVVAVGGVNGALLREPDAVVAALRRIETDIAGDETAVMTTASFLDRLRGTGPLPVAVAREHAALGPVGRASGAGYDVRATLPYGAYRDLSFTPVGGISDGDVQARLRVRWAELHESFRLARAALAALAREPPATPLRRPVEPADGRSVGWAEAPQGEVYYVVEIAGGRLRTVAPRSASFHNLPLFHRTFAGDIFTDFPFIEASFGISIAGVAG